MSMLYQVRPGNLKSWNEGTEGFYGERNRVGQVLKTLREQIALYHAVRLNVASRQCAKRALAFD
jgi:hypothetical protein